MPNWLENKPRMRNVRGDLDKCASVAAPWQQICSGVQIRPLLRAWFSRKLASWAPAHGSSTLGASWQEWDPAQTF